MIHILIIKNNNFSRIIKKFLKYLVYLLFFNNQN